MKRLPKHVFSLTAADIFSRLLSFIAVAYLARTLGPASMGLLAIGAAILTYSSIFADSGLPILGTRSVAAGFKNLQLLVKRIWTSRLILSAITLILGCGILLFAVKHPIIRYVSLVYLLSLIPSALFLDWLFQGLRSMTTLAKGRVLGMTIYLLFILFFVSKASSILLVPVGWTVGVICQGLFFWIAFRKLESSEPENIKTSPAVFDTIRQGIPLGVANLISQLVIQFPIIYMGLFDTTETTGIYSVAFRVIVLLLVFDRVFYTIFFPSISRSFKEDHHNLKKKFDRTLKFVSSGTLYIGIVSILASRSIFPLLFGSEFLDSSRIFQLLVVYFILSVMNSTFTFTLIGVEKEKIYTQSLMLGAIAFFAIMLLPAPIPSVILAPVALILFQLVTMMIMSKELQKLIPVALFRRIFLPIVAASVLIFLFSKLEQVSPVLSVISAIILSLPLLAFVAGINKKDVLYIKQLIL